ncbi:transposase [Microcoleus sp. BR0-C5]|uniref:transposase n=1 Tax=Microcoleus sp. BR0-C5 TaxID=2818713 RepID=UPI002FD20494
MSIDMWGGVPKLIEQLFPNAKIVIDCFHVMKAVNKDLNKLRRAVAISDIGSKYLFFSNRSNLNVEQIQRLAVTLKKSEWLRIAYEMKEEFREIYETHMTVNRF